MISVMVVDDHPMWRNGVARDLTEHGFHVCATAADAESAVRIAGTVRPDVVLMDLNLGTPSGVDATRRIVAALDRTRVLVLSASGEHADDLVRRARFRQRDGRDPDDNDRREHDEQQ